MRRDRPCTELSYCRSCKAPVYWVVWNGTGKAMPVDAVPVKDGTVVVSVSQSTNTLRAEKFDASNEKHAAKGRKRYVSHFATCPDANQHRSNQ